eukprot:1160816-Pelagomonas_calceolata.AAC.2
MMTSAVQALQTLPPPDPGSDELIAVPHGAPVGMTGGAGWPSPCRPSPSASPGQRGWPEGTPSVPAACGFEGGDERGAARLLKRA